MEFQSGRIDGVIRTPLQIYRDKRGWLCELFRIDELNEEFHPVMAYLSMTEPGICRGPHEHVDQADCFCFLGPSDFELRLWDRRADSPTCNFHESIVVGASNPKLVIIPPGVVHGYKNIGKEPGLVVNCPNRLYKGEGKSEPVDEIRHEDDPDSPYQM